MSSIPDKDNMRRRREMEKIERAKLARNEKIIVPIAFGVIFLLALLATFASL